MAKGRRGPKAGALNKQYEHSFQHRGEGGMFGNIFKGNPPIWKIQDGDNEFAIIPYLCKKNSMFRKRNPDLNKPFTKSQLKSGEAWAYAFIAFVHQNCGPNRDNKLCPRTWNERCPRCEERDRIREIITERKEQDKGTTKLEKKARELFASKRAIYNVVSFNRRKERKEGVKLWIAPNSSIEEVLVKKARDKETLEFRDFGRPEEGWNVAFEFNKRAKQPSDIYSEVELKKRKKDFGKKELRKLYEQAFVIDEIIEVATPEEIEELTFGFKSKESKKRRKIEREESDNDNDNNDDDNDNDDEDLDDDNNDDENDNDNSDDDYENDDEDEDNDEDNDNNDEDEKPECFGKDFNEIDDCDECPADIFKACMKETERKARKKRKKK